jgi:ribosomal protein L11 methyltransferase
MGDPTSQATHVMRFATSEADARRASGLLFEQLDPENAAVAAFENAGGWTVEVHFRKAPDPEAMRKLVQATGVDVANVTFEQASAADWVGKSLAGLRPVRVGRFVVHGAHDRGKYPANLIGIEIEAALAFGTGHHGTTQGCLAAIAQIAREKRVRRVLDLGTGTGVLAIAAARMTRRPVVAGDVDPLAVATARTNAYANGTASFVRVVRAAGAEHSAIRGGAPYDLVLANILLKPLQALARPVSGLLAPGGAVVLSGLTPDQVGAAVAAWRSQGLALRQR